MKKSFIAALLTATCAISTSAFAAPIALDGSFGSNLSNKTYDAVFSGKSFLPENYTVNGLSFSFTFLDNGGTFKNSAPSVTSTSATEYKYYNGGFFSDTNYRRNVTVNSKIERSSEQETAQLSFGDLVLGSGATTLVTSSADGGSSFASIRDKRVNCFIWCDNYNSQTTTKTSIVTKDFTGGFTISGIVSDQSIIDQLLSSGDLTLSLKVAGNLLLTGAQVMLDYTEVETPAEVPEPSSVLLAGAGLAAIGFARRRRTAAKA
jgi:hypothetical protein